MKWEFSSMLTVSLMLILVPFTGQFGDQVFENPAISLFPGLTFIVVGLIGGYLTDHEYKKAIVMVAFSYLVIGVFAASAISVSCLEAGSEECYYINYTLFLGIPAGTILSALGLFFGYKLKEYRNRENNDNQSPDSYPTTE